MRLLRFARNDNGYYAKLFLVVPPIAAILRPRGTPRMQENARFDSFPLSHERDLNSFDSPSLKRGIQEDFFKGWIYKKLFL